jgi:hypothetical protein
MSLSHTSLLPRLQSFAAFAERLGVDPDVLRRDDECPAVVVIGGVEHADLEGLARFEVSLMIRAWGEECELHRAKAARLHTAEIAAGETVPTAPEAA